MNDSFIAVIDSGIGGISLLKKLVGALPYKNYIYLGDEKNAPYGNKSVKALLEISMRNVEFLKRYNLEAIVLGCNTLSVNLLDEIKTYSGLPVFGVFPPIESSATSGNKTLLLATCTTANRYRGIKGVDVVGLKDLAREIENHAFSLEKVNFEKNLINSVGVFVDEKGYYERVILGCTHYFFIQNKIFDHFCPHKILSGEDFTVKNVSKYFGLAKKQVNYYQNKILFVGEFAKKLEKFYFLSGQVGSKL